MRICRRFLTLSANLIGMYPHEQVRHRMPKVASQSRSSIMTRKSARYEYRICSQVEHLFYIRIFLSFGKIKGSKEHIMSKRTTATDTGQTELKPGYIQDYISGIPVTATPEEIDAVQVFA